MQPYQTVWAFLVSFPSPVGIAYMTQVGQPHSPVVAARHWEP